MPGAPFPGGGDEGSNPIENISMIDFLKLPSPCYVLDETLLDRNLAVIDRVRRESGAEIIVALKACG